MNTYQNPLIYLVYDDQDSHYMLKFNCADPHTNYSYNGDDSEFINQLRQCQAYSILLGLPMPIKAGYEALGLPKREGEGKALPIIIYNATAMTSDVNWNADSGCSVFLVKFRNSLADEGSFRTSLLNVNLSANEN